MAAIVSYGAHVPRMRLGPATKNWPHRTERAACNFDEDTVTMAVAAANACLAGFDRDKVDAVFLASTSLPYVEKQTASLVAVAADLRSDIVTVDVAHSLRAATQALRLALDGVAAGSYESVLVIATDQRRATPGSDLEANGGDAAVALLVGNGEPVLTVTAWASVVNDILDVWRSDGDRLLRATPEEHFRYEDGYLHAITTAASALAAKTGRAASDYVRAILCPPDARRHNEAIRRLGLQQDQAVPIPAGSSGAAMALLQLAAALETAAPGEELLLLNYGDGADALALEIGAGISAVRQRQAPVSAQLSRGIPIEDYYDFLRWRGLGPVSANGARVAPAPHALYREQDEVLRFHGMRCRACGMVQYPAQRVCVRCQAKDEGEPVRMAEGGATLFSYSMDYVAATPDVPLVHGVVDFEAGGRAMMLLTDRDLGSVAIGMKLDLTLRKFSEADGVHTYLWKAMPAG